jgi:hypothetical protein
MYSAGKRRYREGMQWALVCWFLGGVRRSDGGVGHCMSASHGQMNEIQIRSGQVTGSPKRNAASIIIQIRSRPLLSSFFFSGPAQNTHTSLFVSQTTKKCCWQRMEWTRLPLHPSMSCCCPWLPLPSAVVLPGQVEAWPFFFGTGPFSTPTLNILSERAFHLTWLRRTELLLIDRLILRLLRKSWNRSRRKALSNRLLLRL